MFTAYRVVQNGLDISHIPKSGLYFHIRGQLRSRPDKAGYIMAASHQRSYSRPTYGAGRPKDQNPLSGFRSVGKYV
jgi:hypothetical protein